MIIIVEIFPTVLKTKNPLVVVYATGQQQAYQTGLQTGPQKQVRPVVSRKQPCLFGNGLSSVMPEKPRPWMHVFFRDEGAAGPFFLK
jgi:hypothetical protein